MVIAVTNRKLCRDDFVSRVRSIMDAEPYVAVLREKDLTDYEYLKLAEEIIAGNDKYRRVISLNRPRTAAALGVVNVHLTISDISKNGRPSGFERVGVSVHSPEEAVAAERLGADYLIAGHIYETECKKDLEPRGISFLKKVVKSVSIPVFAIGGICAENYREPIENGAYGVCLMSEPMTCCEPYKRIIEYKS